jgi:hypothetical protein
VLNKHRKIQTDFRPHCYICGKEIRLHQDCVSTNGKRVNGSSGPNIVWFHASCSLRHVGDILQDARTLEAYHAKQI